MKLFEQKEKPVQPGYNGYAGSHILDHMEEKEQLRSLVPAAQI